MEVVQAVAGRRPVSAALGELADPPVTGERLAGVSFAKVGLANAPSDWRDRLKDLFPAPREPGSVAPVAAAYAEESRVGAPAIADVLDWAVGARAWALLIDTAIKDSHDLLDSLSAARLSAVIASARHAGMRIALAGSLQGERLGAALALGPDIVAVRGAACAGRERRGAVEQRRVRGLAELIAAHNARVARTAG
jgi:uncharacterized protein (UPF0264 family)